MTISKDAITKLQKKLDTEFKELYKDEGYWTGERHTTGASRQVVDAFVKEIEGNYIAEDETSLDKIVAALKEENQQTVLTYLNRSLGGKTVPDISVKKAFDISEVCILPEEIGKLKEKLNTKFKTILDSKHTTGAADQVVDAFVSKLQKEGHLLADNPNLEDLVESLYKENEAAVSEYLNSRWPTRTVSGISVDNAVVLGNKQREVEERNEAATKIQSVLRGNNTRKQVKAETDAATTLQSAFRGMQARKEVGKLKEGTAKEEVTPPKKKPHVVPKIIASKHSSTKAKKDSHVVPKTTAPEHSTKTKDTPQYDSIFKDLLELAKKRSLKDLQASGRSVMVFGNEGKSTIVLSTIREFAQSQSIDTEKEEEFAKLFKTEKGKPFNQHAEAINKEVNRAIDEKIKDNTLTNLSPSKQPDAETTTYKHKKSSLTQTGNDKDGYKFNTKGDFSGVLRVQRIMDNGELSEDNVDVVEYENGKPIAVSMAKEGNCRITDIGLIEREVGRNAGISVSTEKQTGVQVMSSSSLTPSSVPTIKQSSKTAKGR